MVHQLGLILLDAANSIVIHSSLPYICSSADCHAPCCMGIGICQLIPAPTGEASVAAPHCKQPRAVEPSCPWEGEDIGRGRRRVPSLAPFIMSPCATMLHVMSPCDPWVWLLSLGAGLVLLHACVPRRAADQAGLFPTLLRALHELTSSVASVCRCESRVGQQRGAPSHGFSVSSGGVTAHLRCAGPRECKCRTLTSHAGH